MPSLLLTAQDLLPGRPAGPDVVRARAERQARAMGRRVVDGVGTLIPFVQMGCWVALCPHCNSGVAVHPDWTEVTCLGLGCYRHYPVAFPARRILIEAALAVRPMRHQFWLSSDARTRASGGRVVLPDETVEDLVAENLANGLPERLGKERP